MSDFDKRFRKNQDDFDQRFRRGWNTSLTFGWTIMGAIIGVLAKYAYTEVTGKVLAGPFTALLTGAVIGAFLSLFSRQRK